MEHPLILIVDDSPVERAVIAGILSELSNPYCSTEQASNGIEALEMIERVCPAMVITDLQMPEMNGLELVGEIRSRHPHIPCVLVTSQGSESLAAEALRRGAASYVPKRSLAELLPDTVMQVLDATGGELAHRSLKRFCVRREAEYQIRNDVQLIAPMVAVLQQAGARQFLLEELELIQLGIALGEALRNAIDHGNLELDSELKVLGEGEFEKLAEFRRHRKPWCHRRVHVLVRESPNEIVFKIRDEGPGFDAARLDYDPTSPENLTRPCGRGLFLIRAFMDEVSFSDRGNEITMVRRGGHSRHQPVTAWDSYESHETFIDAS
jgi:CheY-like chemotaxis protein